MGISKAFVRHCALLLGAARRALLVMCVLSVRTILAQP